jgi:DnaJ-class molecular chaperone
MPKFRTHYDNLKVSRDAPVEVIQAAYRSLARKYHPDMTGGTAEGEAIMRILNDSYEVLSDPVKRAKHDAWIAAQVGAAPTFTSRTTAETHRSPNQTTSSREPTNGQNALTTVILRVAFLAAAKWLIRTPGLSLLGVLLLLAGWAFLQARPK